MKLIGIFKKKFFDTMCEASIGQQLFIDESTGKFYIDKKCLLIKFKKEDIPEYINIDIMYNLDEMQKKLKILEDNLNSKDEN